MKCPFCGKDNTSVLESRITEDGAALRRRRKCEECDKRFTTYERVEGQVLWVIKKDGRREPFNKEKVRSGVLKAIEKRPVPLAAVDKLVNQVEKEMLQKETSEISTRKIGQAVLKRLKKLDQVAWLRFASVYLAFEDITDFEAAIHKI